MKVTSQNLQRLKTKAFTLIEMIGVLAVIAILAALLIPKIFEAINNARVNNAALSCNTVKTAIADHYAKFGTLLTDNGTNALTAPVANFDRILLSEGFLDKPFQVKIGDGITNQARLVASVAAATAPAANNAAYDLDGTNAVNDAIGGVVVEAYITGVSEADAKDLNDRLDGPSLGTPIGTDDMIGRVKYATGDPTEVRVYLTHR